MATLDPITEKFILHWGEMGTRWGVNRTVAQIHALLYVSPEPMNAEEIAGTLSIARSNVSTSLRELESWGIVKAVHLLGDRREHYQAMKDVREMARIISGRAQAPRDRPHGHGFARLPARAGREEGFRRGTSPAPEGHAGVRGDADLALFAIVGLAHRRHSRSVVGTGQSAEPFHWRQFHSLAGGVNFFAWRFQCLQKCLTNSIRSRHVDGCSTTPVARSVLTCWPAPEPPWNRAASGRKRCNRRGSASGSTCPKIDCSKKCAS